MKISIKYCTKWNYEPRASSLGDELKEAFAADVELVASGGGVFDIVVDDKTVFSKKAEKRFPNDGEVISLIKG